MFSWKFVYRSLSDSFLLLFSVMDSVNRFFHIYDKITSYFTNIAMKTVYTTKIHHFDFSGLKQIPKKTFAILFCSTFNRLWNEVSQMYISV